MRRRHRGAAVAVGLVLLLAVLPAVPDVQAAPAVARPVSGDLVHVVRAGETLGLLARRYHVTVAALVAANRLASARALIRVGQRLVIPGSTAATPAVQAAARGRPPETLILAVPDFDGLAPRFEWPLEGPVSSRFGRRRLGWHGGIDIKADLGTPVFAAAGGIVTASGVERRYGLVVKIEHPDGFTTVYAHNLKNLVEVGDEVAAGQVIAQVGRTGRASSHHLHFEIRRAGTAYNPLYLLPWAPRAVARVESDHEDADDD